MTLKDFIKEFWQMIKDKKWRIIGVAVLFALFALATQFLFSSDSENYEQVEDQSSPATFNFYMEDSENTVFTNSFLIEIFATDEDTVEDIEQDSGVNFSGVIEEFNENFDETYTEEDPINIERNRSSNLMIFTANIGTAEENLAVAQSYYDWVSQNNSSFFEDKTVYMVDEPTIVPEDETQTNAQNAEAEESSTNLFVPTLLGLIFGALIGVAFEFLIQLFSKVIHYSFSYGVNQQDQQIILRNSNTDLSKVFNLGEPATRIIFSEFSVDKLNTVNSLKEYQHNEKHLSVDEFIIIIQKHETTKEWYESVRNLLNLYPNTLVKVIEL